MDGFTGLDIAQAKSDILSFHHAGLNAVKMFDTCMANLFSTLSIKWASPNAKEFSHNKIEKIRSLRDQALTSLAHIASGACEAAAALARANGVDFDKSFISVEAGATYGFATDIPECKEELNGVIGMDTESVRIALMSFKEEASHAITAFQEMPGQIAFFDPAGNMITAYNRNIKEYGEQAEELINELSADIEGYISTETDNILLAKQNATQTMNG